MICLTKKYCLELAEQKNYTAAIHIADRIARDTDSYLAVIEDITTPIFEIIQKNCQQFADLVNYSEAYNLWKKTSNDFRKIGLYSMPGLEKIKDFINKDLVKNNSFERVCMEIEQLEANDFRNNIIEEIAEAYFESSDFNHASELIDIYNLTYKTMLLDKIKFTLKSKIDHEAVVPKRFDFSISLNNHQL